MGADASNGARSIGHFATEGGAARREETSVPVWPQFRARAYWQIEPAALREFYLSRNPGHPSDKAGCGLFNLEASPCAPEEKEHDTGSVHGCTLVGTGPNAEVHREHCPSAFAIKRGDPGFVRRASREFVAQCDDLVFLEKHIDRSRKARAQIVVKQQLQAASLASKATAVRTAETAIS